MSLTSVHSFASELWVLDADGGGGVDYTTFAAFEIAQNTNLVGRGVVTGLCYGATGDLGIVKFFGGYGTNATAADHIEVIVADGHRHDGTTNLGYCARIVMGDTNAPGFVITDSYFVLDGLAVLYTNSAGTPIFIYGDPQVPVGRPVTNVVVKNCLVVNDGTAALLRGIEAWGNTCAMVGIRIHNCAIYGGDKTQFGIYLKTYSVAPPIDVSDYTLEYCSVEGCYYNGICLSGAANAPGNWYLTNNIALDATSGCFAVEIYEGISTGTVWATYQVSTDPSATNWGAANYLTNQIAADLFVDPGHDMNVKEGANIINWGVAIAGITDDIVGTSRPQGAAPEPGAFEYIAAAAVNPCIVDFDRYQQDGVIVTWP